MLFLFSTILHAKFSLGCGDRIEMTLCSYNDLQNSYPNDLQNIIDYLESEDKVTLHFYEFELGRETFIIDISKSQFGTLSVIIKNLSTKISNAFLFSSPTTLIDLLKEKLYNVQSTP